MPRELTSAPGTRTSKRVADGGAPGGPIILTDAARDSYPYDAVSGAHIAYHREAISGVLEMFKACPTSPPNNRL